MKVGKIEKHLINKGNISEKIPSGKFFSEMEKESFKYFLESYIVYKLFAQSGHCEILKVNSFMQWQKGLAILIISLYSKAS